MQPAPFHCLYLAPADCTAAVQCSGVLAKLIEEVPGAKVTIVASPKAASLFADVPGLERILILEGGSLWHWIELWLQLRGMAWDVIVDLRGSMLSSYLRRKRRAVLPKSVDGEHPVRAAAKLFGLEAAPPEPRLWMGTDRRRQASDLMAGSGPILAIGPGSSWMGKVWPAERYALLAVQLLGEEGPLAGGRLAIIGAADEVRDIDSLRRALPRHRIIDLTGIEDPLLVYACLEHCRLFIGNDSAWMHLAAASGTATLGLFGPSDEQTTAPWGHRARIVRGSRSYAQFRDIDPQLDQALSHMNDLPVASVVRAARDLIGRTELVDA